MKAIVKSAEQSAREIRLVATGSREHSKVASRLLNQLVDVRRITQRNVEGVGRTRGGTADLLKQAQTLTGLMNTAKSKSTNGRPKR